jgi:hypothetical protein
MEERAGGEVVEVSILNLFVLTILLILSKKLDSVREWAYQPTKPAVL